jgi:hypothetical protein
MTISELRHLVNAIHEIDTNAACGLSLNPAGEGVF